MKINVKKSVLKEVEKAPKSIKELVAENIKALMKAESISELNNIKSMEGTEKPYYRLKLRTHRLLVHYEKETNTVTIHALTHRKDTYKKENLPWRK